MAISEGVRVSVQRVQGAAAALASTAALAL